MVFETKKVFADMQTKDNFIKTIEIMKEDSLQKVLQQNMSIGLGNANFVVSPKGLLTVDMEIVDCDCYYQSHIELQHSEIEHHYKLIFDGFHRVKVKDLKRWILDTTIPKDFPSWLFKELGWMLENKYWLFDKSLKDQEYCIIFFVNKEETFKANGWEGK
ncbi:hypothetical protein [Spiroplasma endosymbiont of Glossina fuscipes fuscipes]|uniref:hypothetical protein n=1 Tax=Spiroplasma endosymbiont of Glossina fuscipes fuscipes TaxID=2004463 RepID=UPI003C751384